MLPVVYDKLVGLLVIEHSSIHKLHEIENIHVANPQPYAYF